MGKKFTHMTEDGRPSMVDVSGKDETARRAVAGCTVRMSPETFRLLVEGGLPKGEAFTVAQVAGIQAAKRTHELIPLCHPLAIRFADVTFETNKDACEVRVTAEVRCQGKTGVEMEALTAAQVAALTLYDMCKAIQRDIVITDCRLLHKSGGKSGVYDAD